MPSLAAQRPPSIRSQLTPQPLSELESTDVGDEPDGDTAVVQRDVGTDPRAASFASGAHRRLRADQDDDDDGDTAIVRTENTRIAGLHEKVEDDDYTDRIHKSLALLGRREDSDVGVEPTQVTFKRKNAVRSAEGTDPRHVQATSIVRRETVEGLAPAGATLGRGRKDDVDDSTDRVMRAGAGGLEPVPREITIIDHSRRSAAVDDWAREARVRRRSNLRRAVLIAFVFLLIGTVAVGAMYLHRIGRLRMGSEPSVGSLVVMSQPNGAEVLIDGNVVGTTPFSSQKVPTGAHELTVRSLTGQQKSLEVVIKEGEPATREVRLID